MSALRHRTVTTNGITMHYAEQGEGPLVVLCHGFPECWYSWRHQLPALAAAGYRVVAPDQRGYARTDPKTLPPWLTEQDLDVFAAEFARTGFRGGLNWYRNLDRMWELTPFLTGAKIRQPALFAAGEADAVVTMYRPAFDAMEQTAPGLRKKVLLPGAGHWVQQE